MELYANYILKIFSRVLNLRFFTQIKNTQNSPHFPQKFCQYWNDRQFELSYSGIHKKNAM